MIDDGIVVNVNVGIIICVLCGRLSVLSEINKVVEQDDIYKVYFDLRCLVNFVFSNEIGDFLFV